MYRTLILSIVSISFAHLVDFRQFAADDPVKPCTKPGTLCETCSSLVACIQQPDETWTKAQVATCSAPAYCVNGACTTDFDPFCSGFAAMPLPCPRAGIFPDPFYCNRYHLCTDETSGSGPVLKDHVYTCEEGFGFNIANDLCDVKLDNGVCPDDEYPVPLCTSAGDNGALPQKPAMYYICEQMSYNSTLGGLYPFLYLCNGDEQYVNFSCSEGPPPTDGPTDGPTDEPTDVPTDGPTDAPTDGPTEGPTDGP